MHTEDAPVGGADDWFEHELAQLHAQLDEIAAWLKTRPATPAPLPRWRPSVNVPSLDANEPSVPIGRGLAASAQPGQPAAPAVGAAVRRDSGAAAASDATSAAAVPVADRGPGPSLAASDAVGPDVRAGRPSAPAPAEPPLPTGTDLSDPKNFGMMPPLGDLEQGNASAEDYRQRLGKHLAFATTVLHTSKVPAAVWREWRAFEKAIHERLLALSANKVES